MAVPSTAVWPLSISTSFAGVRAFAASLVLIAFCYTLPSLAYLGTPATADWQTEAMFYLVPKLLQCQAAVRRYRVT